MTNKHYPKTVIVGLGITGLACARYLANKGQEFAITDSRSQPPALKQLDNCSASLFLGEIDQQLLLQADDIIISPGLPLHTPIIVECIKAGKTIIGDIELFARDVTKPIIAITGTNGKGTVTMLYAEMAKAAGVNAVVGGNIGIPVLDIQQTDDIDCYVLELSSAQLAVTYSLRNHTSVILNISCDHMDYHQNMQEYIDAKKRIYHHCRHAVINRDFEIGCDVTDAISYGLSAPRPGEFGVTQRNGQYYLSLGEQQLIHVNDVALKGRHNWSNALAALSLGFTTGLPMEAMLQALRVYQGLPHRCRLVTTSHDGIMWFNDSKGTNVAATAAAIASIGEIADGKLVLIAGGVGKNADFTPLIPLVTQYCQQLVLIGCDASILASVFDNCADIIVAQDLSEAIFVAEQKASHGDAVLFSPACASFDMFRHAEHRGEEFERLVEEQVT